VIRTLVVDDDFRVAHLHAVSVERVEGFRCVGEAHSAAQARDMIGQHQPDLLILDIYLPDEDGLSLLRSLAASATPPPDCIFITAARDLESVRAAIGLGAMYYLVKPFGFAQLKDKLESYRRWRTEVANQPPGNEADQSRVDALYDMLRGSGGQGGERLLPPTMAKILRAVQAADGPIGASAVATQLGISRPTAQRYLTELHRRGVLELELEYGSTGRPVNLYHAVRR
jgi:response regulator of citrate/malate metabolism